MDTKEKNVFVRFVTNLEKRYSVKPDPIAVPHSLKRLGLSQIINHLLGSDASPTPFDFLIQKRLLRTSLKSFIASHLQGDEAVIEIEYILALGVSEEDEGLKHDDWVSAVDRHQFQITDVLLTGCYDHIVRVWKNGATIVQMKGHTGPVKCLSTDFKVDGKMKVVSGSNDQTLRVWEVDTETQEADCVNTLAGHSGSIEDCDIEKTGRYIVSGSWDHSIKIWDLTSADFIEQEPVVKCQTTLGGHKQPVLGVQWLPSGEEVVSASFDHSVKFWDIESGNAVVSLSSNTAIYGLSVSVDTNIVMTSHIDRTVRVWDRRQSQSEVCQTLSSHKGWVSSVSCHPTNSGLFLSGSYDNTLKLWDLRSNTPLHTLKSHQDKVLTVGWKDASRIISGGADNMLRTHKMSE